MKKIMFFFLFTLVAFASCRKPPHAHRAKIIISKDPEDAPDHVVQINATTKTGGVPLMKFKASAEGSDETLKRIPVTITVFGPSVERVSDVISTISLWDHNGPIDQETVPMVSEGLPFGPKTVTILFENFQKEIQNGTIESFSIKGEVNPVSEKFTQGTYAIVELTHTDVLHIGAYDINNDPIHSLIGESTGSKNYFYSNSIAVSSGYKPTNIYTPPPGAQTHGKFTMMIPFTVSANGTTAYIPSATTLVTTGSVNVPTATAAPSIQFAVDDGSLLLAGATGSISYTGPDNLSADAKGNYQIPVGQSKNFLLTITYVPTAAGSFRAQMVNINWSTDEINFTSYTVGLNAQVFRTDYIAGK